VGHSGATDVRDDVRLVLRLTPVQAVQARPPGCWVQSCIVSYCTVSEEGKIVTITKNSDSKTLWNNTSKVVPSAKNPKQISHEGKHLYNDLMYLQEKVHSNTYRWTLSQTYPDQTALTAYS